MIGSIRDLLSVTLIVIFSVAVAGQTAFVAVTGVVFDQRGAVVPGASVVLERGDGSDAAQTVTTDDNGSFRFNRVATSDYRLRIERQGFASVNLEVNVGMRPPAALRISLYAAHTKKWILTLTEHRACHCSSRTRTFQES